MNYLRYQLDDSSVILVQVSDESEGRVNVGRVGERIADAQKSFADALDSVKISALQIRQKFHDLQADEVEVKFGLIATGDFGSNVFAVCQVGVEANYEVTLKWNKKSPDRLNEQIQELQEIKQLKDQIEESR